MRPQFVEDLAQQPLRLGQKTVVVQRPAAAEGPSGKDDVEADSFEHLRRGDRRIGMEMIVERVRPQQDP